VSVLRQLHDDLDAAVLAAYGWSDLCAGGAGFPSGAGFQPATNGLGSQSEAGFHSGAGFQPATNGLGSQSGAGFHSGAGFQPATAAADAEAELLRRLVALNAERAAEERRGLVRWLRPDFQNPGGSSVQTSTEVTAATPAATATGPRPDWPKGLPEQIAALRAALAAQPGPAGTDELARAFNRAPKAKVAELLQVLAGLGHARALDDGRWSGT
jgi:hypothetical protein